MNQGEGSITSQQEIVRLLTQDRGQARRQRTETEEQRETRLRANRERDRTRRQQENPEQRERRLQADRQRRRRRLESETPEQRAQRLQAVRDRRRRRRQQETSDHRRQRADARRQSTDKFKTSLLVTVDYCFLCHHIVFEDKAKKLSSSLFRDAFPDDIHMNVTTNEVLLCTKCNTQISKHQWPSWAVTNGLVPDKIPVELASLTSDEVRTISRVCPFLKVIILPGGQFGEEGSVIHFPFPVQQVMNHLPRPLSESEVILSCAGLAQRETFQTMLEQINQQHVYRALMWLRANNALYSSISLQGESNSAESQSNHVTTSNETIDQSPTITEPQTSCVQLSVNVVNPMPCLLSACTDSVVCNEFEPESHDIEMHDEIHSINSTMSCQHECESDEHNLTGTHNIEIHEAMHNNTCQHNQSTESANQVVSNSADHEGVIMGTEEPEQRRTHFIESCMASHNYVAPDIPIEQLLAQQNSAPQLCFPHMTAQPVNMFQEENLEEKAFPTLFPRGRYGLGHPRTKPITDLKYFQSRLFNKEARWRNNIVWVFWALNTFEMRKLQNEISIVSRMKKQNHQPLTAGDITQPTSDSMSQSYMFMKNIRGTAAYWKDQLLDLLARINTLGPPTFFLTLTANDLHWPEYFKLINPNLSTEQIVQMTPSQKLNLLKKHPLHAVMFFEHRLDSFIKNIIMSNEKPLGTVKDYWLRIEFQMRGSPHVHSFWWIEGAPNVDTVEGRQQAPQFIDQYISTTLPDQVQEPQLHSLVQTLQVHKHSPTCYKQNRVNCRFDFPRPTSTETRIRLNTDPGSAARFYVTQRSESDKWINAYNPILLKAWQANMDIQMVGSQYGAAMYVCMYVSKAEPERLKYALHETLQNIPPNASQRKRLSLIGATVLTHRQVSVQEAMYRLGGFPLVRSTRTTVCVSSRQPQYRTRILKPQSEICQLPDGSTEIFQSGTIDYYQDRPDGEEWDRMSLASFATQYNVLAKQTSTTQLKLKTFEKWVSKRQKPACLRIPHLTQASGDEYYYSLLLLFKPFRAEAHLIQDHESVRDAFQRQSNEFDMNSSPYLNMARQIQNAIVTIRLQESSTPSDIAAQVAPNLTSLEDNGSHNEQEIDEQWSHTWATTMSANMPPEGTSSEQYTPTTSPTATADQSLWHQVTLTTMTDEQYLSAINSASADQRAVIDKIFTHNRSRTMGNCPNQLLLFVTGGAGVGKSFLIRTIKEILIRMQTGHLHNPVLLAAPTGIASYNIGGLTTHSGFCLPVEHHRVANYVPLKAEKLKEFRQKFADIHYIIIDEISMLSCQNFAYIHKRLCEIKDTTNDPSILFGGLSILVLGDLFQLKPVHGSFIFDSRKPESYLWQRFDVAILTTNHRQAEDKLWAETLNRIRVGQPTDADIKSLQQRTLIDTSIPPFDNALRIFPTRKQVKEFNEQRLNVLASTQATPRSIYTIEALDTVLSAPSYMAPDEIEQSKPTDDSETAGLAETLKLANGSRVMLIRNIYTDEGLVNGAQGIVEAIEWETDSQVMPRGVHVKFDNPSVGRSLRNAADHEHHEAILIRPITASFNGKCSTHWSRTQLPLTPCWATTIHKVQGITLSHAVVDIGSKVFTSGMSYVALSRVQNIQGLAIQSFEPSKLAASQNVIGEMSRLYAKAQLSHPQVSQN